MNNLGMETRGWGVCCTGNDARCLGHASPLLAGALQAEREGSTLHLQAPEAEHAVLCAHRGRGHGPRTQPGG